MGLQTLYSIYIPAAHIILDPLVGNVCSGSATLESVTYRKKVIKKKKKSVDKEKKYLLDQSKADSKVNIKLH